LITITFKNVGQGDTIVIEWNDNGQQKIGVIDSHIHQSRNPALEHLKAHHYNQIEFIFLSHGHYDHLSGISPILDYCYQKKIQIKNFYHTLSGTIVKVFSLYNSTIKAKAAERLLVDLEKYYSGKDKIIQNWIRTDCSRPNIILTNEIEIEILSPNECDYFELEKSIGQYLGKKSDTKPNTNKVTTILRIKNGDQFVLLTSDAMKSRIGRIEQFLKNEKLILGQVPHHGSKYNHRKQFWEGVLRLNNCIAVFSTGDEPADKLPDDEPVKEIHNLGYKIHSTNQVNGICSVFGMPSEKITQSYRINDLIDFFSNDDMSSYINTLSDDLNGDQSFTFWE